MDFYVSSMNFYIKQQRSSFRYFSNNQPKIPAETHLGKSVGIGPRVTSKKNFTRNSVRSSLVIRTLVYPRTPTDTKLWSSPNNPLESIEASRYFPDFTDSDNIHRGILPGTPQNCLSHYSVGFVLKLSRHLRLLNVFIQELLLFFRFLIDSDTVGNKSK